MKGVRLFVVALSASATIGGVAAGAADATGCRTFRCLRKEVSALSRTVRAESRTLRKQSRAIRTQSRTIRTLRTCLVEAPVTLYGDSSGSNSFGYYFSPEGGSTRVLTDALDATPPGGQVSAWLLTDGCNTTTTANVRMSALSGRARVLALGPIAPVAPLMASFPLPSR